MFQVDPDQRDYRGKLRSQFQTVFGDEESKTVQSDAHLVDIQQILKNAGGLPAMLEETDAQFMDVSEFTDYADMMREVRNAELEFYKLDPKVRALFDHDVYKWLDAAHERRTAPEDVRDDRTRDGDPEPVAADPVVEPVVAPEGPPG